MLLASSATAALLSLISIAPLAAAQPHAAHSFPCGAGAAIVGSPSPGQVGNQLSGVVSLAPHNAWAVGAATDAPGNPPVLVSRPLVAHWDGTAWRSVETPALGAGGALSSIAAISSHDIWAVGHRGPTSAGTPLVEHWNGSAWSAVASPIVAQGYLLGVSGTEAADVWAVGIVLGSTSNTLIEHWNGSTWRVVPSPNLSADYNEIDGVVALSSHLAWAVGYSIVNNTATQMIVRWDGSSWSVVPPPASAFSDNLLRSVAAGSAHDVWAAGQSRSADGSQVVPLVEHWNGRAWAAVSAPAPSTQSWLTGVTVSKDSVWTVGVQVVGFTNHNLVERAEDGTFAVAASVNRGTSDVGLQSIAANLDGTAWAVGMHQGRTKGESLVLALCSH